MPVSPSNLWNKNVKIINSSFSDLIEKQNIGISILSILMNHNEKATLSYFNWAIENVCEKDVFVFDDIYWSKEMYNAWKRS